MAHPERNIVWVRWRDPLKPLATACRPLVEEGEDPVEISEARESWGNVLRTGYVEDPVSPTGDVGVGIISPLGVFPLHESNVPSKIFNFWMAHANFVIDDEAREAIKNAPGVESLTVFTPYRARVAIGLAFRERDVKQSVLEAVRSVGQTKTSKMVRAAKCATSKAGRSSGPTTATPATPTHSKPPGTTAT